MSKHRKSLDVAKAAALFKVLGHPHRLAIVLQLCDRCGAVGAREEEAVAACVGDLSKGLDISPSTVSHHLKELRQAGIITMERDGQHVQCCPNLEVVAQLNAFIGEKCCGG